MDLTLSPQEESFRDELRAWLAENHPGQEPSGDEAAFEFRRAWQRKLDDGEWAFMKTHTIIGERILAAAPALAPMAKLVRSSHERWDGGGYPDGLAGEDIPLGARIIAVCDSFDAMISDRPYSAARSVADAVAELERCAGTQFDPAVVAAFVAEVRRPALTAAAA